MRQIEQDIRAALDRAGFGDAKLSVVLSPAWTTDWISDKGREKLRGYGIAPPVDGTAADGRLAARVDSMLGQETLDALNVSAEFRLAQIAANLERHRWLPRTLGDRYILVNVPAFRLQAYDNGKPTLEMKVIVGSEFENRATPVFSDRMEFVVFRPYWNVTDNIAQNELFPQFARTGMPADLSLAARMARYTSTTGRSAWSSKPGTVASKGTRPCSSRISTAARDLGVLTGRHVAYHTHFGLQPGDLR